MGAASWLYLRMRGQPQEAHPSFRQGAYAEGEADA
eukprot:CAMPEP_0206611490 /NCGR_PEP_ID=MMETSP0325_2-20121206/55304_1 /ASSEMBLY_ACC=CAM_ASM_000347 /TAXON_ID=2866 /ORGANISM="Crypthecodinium cohnii, Strain Seligo" /LENGTH=34 /DNA_ID= /DNA_START= /DNA_END= /DNA_ORIENTATION=